jgi:hypothetical protein
MNGDANQRQSEIESNDALVSAIPSEQWKHLEQSICDTIEDQGTPLTEADFQRYRELARGGIR